MAFKNTHLYLTDAEMINRHADYFVCNGTMLKGTRNIMDDRHPTGYNGFLLDLRGIVAQGIMLDEKQVVHHGHISVCVDPARVDQLLKHHDIY